MPVEARPPRSGADTDAVDHVDYRYTLANERTFLAYVRTALGLDAAALAAAQFLHPSAGHLRIGIAVTLAFLGIALSVAAYRRWRAVEASIRVSEPLPRVRLPLMLGAGMAIISVGALAVVVTGRW